MSRGAVVVMGLDCPTGLQAARVFTERGIDVIGIASNPRHPCARTRSCRRIVIAERDPESMAAALFELADQLEDRAVLLPCTDLAVIGVARHRKALGKHFLTSVPCETVIRALMDKAAFAEFAAQHSLPIPETHVIRSRADAERVAPNASYPGVFKPSVKTPQWDDQATGKTLIVESPAELLESYDRHARCAEAFVVQELIPGDDTEHFTCDGYFTEEGDPLVTFTTRKLRQWPPTVGQGCLSVECRNDAVREEAIRLFRKAGHYGQGYLEAKWDARTGRHLIIEANVGRPTGRSAAAERAGVELLMTMYCDLVGEPLPVDRVQKYRGVKWIFLRRDLQACARLLITGRAGPLAILRSWKGPFAFAIFALRDPVPFLADLWSALTRFARSRDQGRKSRKVPGLAFPTDATATKEGRRIGPFMAIAVVGVGLLSSVGSSAILAFG